MQPALNFPRNTAYSVDVERFNRDDRFGDSGELLWLNVSRGAKQWISFLVLFIGFGYTDIEISIGALKTAFERTKGFLYSKSSLHRFLAELEKAGFIRRQKCRIGYHRFISKIHFTPALFELADKLGSGLGKNETGKHTSHLAPQVSKRDHDKRTKYPGKLQHTSSERSSCSVVKKPRASARANLEENRIDPVLYTLKIVTAGRPDRGEILATARLEIEGHAPAASGVDWKHWQGQWWRMIHPEREAIVMKTILPALVNIDRMDQVPELPYVDQVEKDVCEMSYNKNQDRPPTAKELETMKNELEQRGITIGLSLEELAILSASADRAENQSRCSQ